MKCDPLNATGLRRAIRRHGKRVAIEVVLGFALAALLVLLLVQTTAL